MKDPWKIVFKSIDMSDMILEVVDSRFPELCRSTAVERKVEEQGKVLLIILNKSDLIPREVGEAWIDWFSRQGKRATLVSARGRLGTSVMRKLIQQYAPKKQGDVIVSLVGLPNTGKSSLTNILKGHASAKVAPVPGYTKHQQLFRISKKMLLYDTPGVIPLKIPFEDQLLLGIRSPDRLKDPLSSCEVLIQRIEELSSGILEESLGVKFEGDPYEYLEKLAVKRGVLKKGGIADVDRMARTFLHDYLKEKIPVYQKPPVQENEERELQ